MDESYGWKLNLTNLTTHLAKNKFTEQGLNVEEPKCWSKKRNKLIFYVIVFLMQNMKVGKYEHKE